MTRHVRPEGLDGKGLGALRVQEPMKDSKRRFRQL
jgi:hypothetical protein